MKVDSEAEKGCCVFSLKGQGNPDPLEIRRYGAEGRSKVPGYSLLLCLSRSQDQRGWS